MRFLAISGSLRTGSTNTALLRSIAQAAHPAHYVSIFRELANIPVFSPDLETPEPPAPVMAFADAVRHADGLIISSPEYVHAIPGGLKNAIDWLVSRDEIIAKPIVLVHASHRGEDMLGQLRLVLSTVSERFSEDLFLRLPLMNLSPDEIAERLSGNEEQAKLRDFIDRFASYCRL